VIVRRTGLLTVLLIAACGSAEEPPDTLGRLARRHCPRTPPPQPSGGAVDAGTPDDPLGPDVVGPDVVGPDE
jgi:hypothetical protein